MSTPTQNTKIIFTPDDEPYLGRETVCVLDRLILVCLKTNSHIAPRTHKIEKNDLQWAACQIIPAGISLTLSIRELVRQGYILWCFSSPATSSRTRDYHSLLAKIP
jgi:hypothetical protein